jgi:hypothetical protein
MGLVFVEFQGNLCFVRNLITSEDWVVTNLSYSIDGREEESHNRVLEILVKFWYFVMNYISVNTKLAPSATYIKICCILILRPKIETSAL